MSTASSRRVATRMGTIGTESALEVRIPALCEAISADVTARKRFTADPSRRIGAFVDGLGRD